LISAILLYGLPTRKAVEAERSTVQQHEKNTREIRQRKVRYLSIVKRFSLRSVTKIANNFAGVLLLAFSLTEW
jgi:hypothetical protein